MRIKLKILKIKAVSLTQTNYLETTLTFIAHITLKFNKHNSHSKLTLTVECPFGVAT